jgi:hypothetical protein
MTDPFAPGAECMALVKPRIRVKTRTRKIPATEDLHALLASVEELAVSFKDAARERAEVGQ